MRKRNGLWLRGLLPVLPAALALALPAVTHAQARNLDLIGRSDLGGRGSNGEVAVVGDTAVVAAGNTPAGGLHSNYYNPIPCPPVSVKVVDLSTPSAPQTASTIDIPAGVAALDVDAKRVNTPSFSGDLAAVALAICNANGSDVDKGVAYYDISNRANPQFLGRYNADVEAPGDRASSQHSVSLVPRGDGRVLSLSTEPFTSASGFPSGDLRIVDVTSPRNPTEVGSFPNGTQQPPPLSGFARGFSNNGCRPFDASHGLGEQPPGGTRALLPYYDQGLLNVGLDNPSNPTQLGQFSFPRGDRAFEGNAAYADSATVNGRSLALLATEDWIAPFSTLRIDAPSSLAGPKFGCEAMFTLFDSDNDAQIYRKPGGQVPGGIAYVGRGCPGDAYLTPESETRGKIVLRDRARVPSRQGPLGAGCTFAAATKRAQDLGAVGVVTAQTVATTPAAFSPDGDPAGLSIPSMQIDKGDADALRDALCPAPATAGTGCGPGGQSGSGALVDSPGEWGDLRVVDVSDPSNPSSVGQYRPPRSQVFPPPDRGVYSVHHAVARGGQALVAANSDGLRVLDLTGGGLNEVASFVPPDTADPLQQEPDKALVQGVAAGPQGTIVISDRNSGLYVLRPPTPAAPAVRARPSVRTSRLPRACISRSFRTRVRVSSTAPVRRVRVYVDGRRIATSRRASFTVRVRTRRLRAGRHRLTVIATDAAGGRTRRVVRFRVCAAQRRGPRFTG